MWLPWWWPAIGVVTMLLRPVLQNSVGRTALSSIPQKLVIQIPWDNHWSQTHLPTKQWKHLLQMSTVSLFSKEALQTSGSPVSSDSFLQMFHYLQHLSLIWVPIHHPSQSTKQNHNNEQKNNWIGARTTHQHLQQKQNLKEYSLRHLSHTAQPLQSAALRSDTRVTHF